MWPWNRNKTKVTHNTFAWEDNNIVIVLKADNPLGVDRLYVPNTGKYVVDQSQVYYKILKKDTNATVLALSKEYVSEVIITSDLI